MALNESQELFCNTQEYINSVKEIMKRRRRAKEFYDSRTKGIQEKHEKQREKIDKNI